MSSELLPRHARRLVVAALADTRVVFLMGARQVGKSTLTQDIARNEHPARILTLDDATTRTAASSDPTAFIAGLEEPALIDEVQRAPDLLLAIKAAVDRDPRPGRFLLTGSANILTAPRVAEALTGRMEVVRLWPLAQSEFERSPGNFVDALFQGSPPVVVGAPIGRAAWVDRAARGGYPEAAMRSGRRRDRWFESYLQTMLDRDLREIGDIRRRDEVPRLFRLLAARASSLFVARAVSRSLSVTYETVQTYSALLETVFLIRLVPSWRPGLGAREVHAPKVYVVDTGLLAHLMGADETRIASDDRVTGAMFENFVAMEVLKHVEWAETGIRQFHYRDGRDEVDIVLESRSGRIVCVEAKAAATVSSRDYRALEKLRERRSEEFVAGVVVYTGADIVPLGDRIWALPINALWSS
jgi:hypothetical protein